MTLVASVAHGQQGLIAPRSEDPPVPAPPAPPAPPVAPPPGEVVADVPHVAVAAGGHVAFGSAPAVAVGLTVSAEVDTHRWSFGIEGRYDLSSSGHTAQGSIARTSLAGGAFVPCLRAPRMWACGVVLLANVETSAKEPDSPDVRDRFLFFGIGGRLAFHAGLPGKFALRIGGEVLAHPIPYVLSVDDKRLYKSSAVSMTVGPSIVRVF